MLVIFPRSVDRSSLERQASPIPLPDTCPRCIDCKEPLFDRRPVVVTDCQHRFHYGSDHTKSGDWQLADRKCKVCGAGATGVMEWRDEGYGTVDLRSKLELLESCREGDYTAVNKAVVKAPSLANSTIRSGIYETGQALIHQAAAHGRVSIVNFLLDSGTDVNLANYRDLSPLVLAAEGNFVELADLLLNRGANDLYKAFFFAAFAGSIDTLRELIKHGVEVNFVYGRDEEEWEVTVLNAVLKQRRGEVSEETLLTVVEFLMAQGARASINDLSLAVVGGRLEVVKLLIANGVDVNRCNGAPLCGAVMTNQIELVRELLRCGAMPDKTDAGKTITCCAVEKGNLDIINLLIDAGGNVDPYMVVDGEKTCSPLCEAIHAGHEAVVRMLIERGAGVDIADRSGYTPLARAILAKNSALLRLLLDSGADVNALNGLAMKTAIMLRDCQAVEQLIEKGSNVFAALDTGETPLALANRLNRTDEARVIAAAASNAVFEPSSRPSESEPFH